MVKFEEKYCTLHIIAKGITSLENLHRRVSDEVTINVSCHLLSGYWINLDILDIRNGANNIGDINLTLLDR